jgi:hypothetical protein
MGIESNKVYKVEEIESAQKKGHKWMLRTQWGGYDKGTWDEARQLHPDVPDLLNTFKSVNICERKKRLLEKYLMSWNNFKAKKAVVLQKRVTTIVCRPCCPRSQRDLDRSYERLQLDCSIKAGCKGLLRLILFFPEWYTTLAKATLYLTFGPVGYAFQEFACTYAMLMNL